MKKLSQTLKTLNFNELSSYCNKIVLKCVILFIFAISVVSCGHSNVHYGKITLSNGQIIDMNQELSSIIIKGYSDAIRQRLVEKEFLDHFVDIINPFETHAEPKYSLSFRMKITRDDATTKADGSTGRYNLTMRINYELKDLDTQSLISKNTIKTIASYESLTNNRFSTTNLQDKAISDLTKDAAEALKGKLVNDIYHYKNENLGTLRR